MLLELSITLSQKNYRGDSIDIPCQVDGVITNYKIRCEIFDNEGNSIKLANTASGGGDTEISITDASKGTFVIHISKDTTDSFELDSFIEIELEDTNGKIQTCYHNSFKFNEEKITWTEPS